MRGIVFTAGLAVRSCTTYHRNFQSKTWIWKFPSVNTSSRMVYELSSQFRYWTKCYRNSIGNLLIIRCIYLFWSAASGI
jgi:hypothetical protein